MSTLTDIHAKLQSVDEMADKASALRAEGKKVVLCHGCFDLLHIGHIRYLAAARELGDALFVTVTPNRFVDKGPQRPAFDESLRAEGIASLEGVDAVAINAWPTAVQTLERVRPHIYVKGSDFSSPENDATGKLALEAEACKSLGVELRFTDELVFSSSNLINRFFSSFPQETRQYLQALRLRTSLSCISALLDRMASLRVVVIGDSIMDEYRYCTPLGASSKSPVLAVRQQSVDLFAGGVLAVANHLANFVKGVELFTVLGDKPSHEKIIRQALAPNVTPHFFVRPGVPTVLKRRYLDGYSFSKLLEIYEMSDSDPHAPHELPMLNAIRDILEPHELVIAADFGHGAITPAMRSVLCASSSFLAVNTQLNAGNGMFHTLSQYTRADYVSVTENELRLDTRDRSTPVGTLAVETARRMGSRCVVATRGKKGACAGESAGGSLHVPAFAVNTLDTVGAGDAFLAVSSLAAQLGASTELLCFLGSVAGAIAVKIIGNKKAVSRDDVLTFAASLLK